MGPASSWRVAAHEIIPPDTIMKIFKKFKNFAWIIENFSS